MKKQRRVVGDGNGQGAEAGVGNNKSNEDIEERVSDRKRKQGTADRSFSQQEDNSHIGEAFPTSTRLIVKNIGLHTTERQLKEIFSAKGEVTDVRIMKTKDGKSRQFAFIGFRNHTQCAQAQKYLNNSFINTSKIIVEYAHKIGSTDTDDAQSLPNKRKLDKDGGNDLNKREETKKKSKNEEERDPVVKEQQLNNSNKLTKKEEFFQMMQRNSSNKSVWDNDTVRSMNTQQVNKDCDNDSDITKDYEVISTLGEAQSVNSINVTFDESISDLDYLRSKIVESSNSSMEEQMSLSLSNSNQEVDEEGRLFVRNLPFSCTEEELKQAFSIYGDIAEIHIPTDTEKKVRGYAFVQYMLPESASTALTALDGTSFQGRTLHIINAKKKLSSQNNQENQAINKGRGLSTFQQKKEEERRMQSAKKDGWNASYVRTETVIDALSDRFNVKRTEILTTDQATGGDLAVRVAIGETHIIKENKDFFAMYGVDLNALESNHKNATVKRSNTTILIKNLPHDVIDEEIESMFSNFGSISACLISPNKSIALIEFVEPNDAKMAFSRLAFRKYHHVPIYLEWAPTSVIDKSKLLRAKESQSFESTIILAKNDDSKHKDVKPTESYSTIFIKNLNFSTTEQQLKQFISQKLGSITNSIRAIFLPKKRKGDVELSQGFGFIEFSSEQEAAVALKKIDGVVLDGHAIEAKPSDKRLSAVKPPSSLDDATNKIVIRNLAFQARSSEVRALFSAFGNVKSVRLPRKMGGANQGFAFVEFFSKQEAATALESLKGTHFYGRHLVLEFAKDDATSIQNLRTKANKDANHLRLNKLSAGRENRVTSLLESEASDLSHIM